MQAAPVILRELGEQARRPSLILLRVLSPLLLLVGALHLMFHPVYQGGFVIVAGRALRADDDWRATVAAVLDSFSQQGSTLFAALNLVVLAAIWMLGPLITADCLSRERREGTLGLLLLTPLTARDVVRAKWVAHALRAGVALCATIPVLIIPVLLGGVSGNQILRAVMLDVASLTLALSAGLYASIRWQGPRAVHAGALLIAATSAFAWLLGWSSVEALLNLQSHSMLAAPGWALQRALERFGNGLTVLLGLFLDPRHFLWLASSSPISASPDLLIPAVLVVLAWFLSLTVLRAATRSVERVFSQDPSRQAPSALERRLTRSPLLPRILRHLQRAAQRLSPVLALETLTWRLRVAPWLALLAVGLSEILWIRAPYSATPLPVIALCGVVAASAAAAFQRDRSSGVLELLLTTPGGMRHLMIGKVAALALLALPAAIFLLGMEAAINATYGRPESHGLLRTAWILVAHGSLTAACGLYYSLRLPNVALAALATVLAAAALTSLTLLGAFGIGAFLAGTDLQPGGFMRHPAVWIPRGLIELAMAVLFVFRLEHGLRNGSFSARPT